MILPQIHRPRTAGIGILGTLLLLAAQGTLPAQERSLEEIFPGLRDRAVVLKIVARVVEQDQEEIWHSDNSKVTIPGRPVGIRLVGANVVVAVQFTPYLGKEGANILVAQGQIWVEIPNEGIHYQTTMQTIPLEFGELIYFFPLGSAASRRGNGDSPYIEIQLILLPYASVAENGGEETINQENQSPP
jgi:hypothetical protein